ncbi:DUF2218 domain-containing protein [Shimia sp.]|uniref:DUF2218 domain-containing protein n=1 Tax=Shimia sp. TaxID=1954381 RepID=UPI003B8E1187
MRTPFGIFIKDHAAKSLVRLSTNSAHKVEGINYEASLKYDVPMGTIGMCTNILRHKMTNGAEKAGTLAHIKNVIDVHLERDAFREEFKNLYWAN